MLVRSLAIDFRVLLHNTTESRAAVVASAVAAVLGIALASPLASVPIRADDRPTILVNIVSEREETDI